MDNLPKRLEPLSNDQHLASPFLGGDSEDRSLLRDSVSTVVQARWLLAATMAAALVVGGAYFALVTPTYRSEVVLQVEERSRAAGSLDDPSGLEASSTAEAEIEVLRSRALLGKVVDDLLLDVRARPRYFPLIGAALARRWPGAPPWGALRALGRFARGGERLRVDRFDVPTSMVGHRFTLIAGRPRLFQLRDANGTPLLGGEVGAPAAGGAAGEDRMPVVKIRVAELAAREGTEFTVERLDRAGVVERLRRSLVVSERGKKAGLISIALDGPDRVILAATLDGIVRAYQRQNTERRQAAIASTTEFVKDQLPRLRARIDDTERALNRRSQGEVIDAGLEARSTLERLASIEKEIAEVEIQAAEARRSYTARHPISSAIRAKLAQLKKERGLIEGRLKSLPKTESTRATRDLNVASELYGLLLSRSQGLQLAGRDSSGNVRVVDPAFLPHDPISPDLGKVIVLSLAAGLGLGVAGAFTHRAFSPGGVEDPELIERETGIPVCAGIPHSRTEAMVSRRWLDESAPNRPILAALNPTDLAVEAIRIVRTNVRFALKEARSNIVVVAGPSPGTGKSFVSVNMAQVLADAGSRVLLVDADLRKGQLHRHFGVERAPGLSGLVRGAATRAEAVQGISRNLFLLPAGQATPNPSELLESARYHAFIAGVSAEFDVVIVDTAPVLAVTDAVLAGCGAGATLLVLRAGRHHLREIVMTARRMAQNGVRPDALIVNDVVPGSKGGLRSRYGYYYQYDS